MVNLSLGLALACAGEENPFETLQVDRDNF